MNFISSAITYYKNGNLILQICIGIILGVLIGLVSKDLAAFANIFGNLFTGALKATS